MSWLVDHPFVVFAVALCVQWCSAYLGDLLRRTVRPVGRVEREDFDTVLTATLTLLALIIGFSFTMAVSRYDQRKDFEEAEANAIGTEFLRADLLPGDSASKVRELLKRYVEQRIAFYRGDATAPAADGQPAGPIEAELWSVVAEAAKAQQTPINALTVSGMNDVLNSQGYTQASWLNRIPGAAWDLLGVIAIFCNLLLGYRERKTGLLVLTVLPVVSSIAFFLIADIDAPRGGVIRVIPYNLIAVAQSIGQN